MGHFQGRDDHHLPSAQGREVARRGGGHGRRRGLHVSLHDRPQDADGLRRIVPADPAGRGAGSLHLPGDLRETVLAGAAFLGDLDPAPAHPGGAVEGGRGPADDAAEPLSHRERPVPVPGVEDGGEGRPGGESRLLRGPPVHQAGRVSDHPRSSPPSSWS